MASFSLIEELNCSICLDIYTDPVTLTCGHIFCQGCIAKVLDVQEQSNAYFCPECRQEFSQRPLLEKNRKLCSIVEVFLTSGLSSGDLSTKATAPSDNTKCAIHNEVLQYFCLDDELCVCESCCFSGSHGGHQVGLLQEAFEIKRADLTSAWQILTTNKSKSEQAARDLRQCLREAKVKASAEKMMVTQVLGDIRRQLDDLEKRGLEEISRREEQEVQSISDSIHQLDLEIATFSQQIRDCEMIFKVSDPLAFLQESTSTKLCDKTVVDDKHVHATEETKRVSIFKTLLTGLEDIMAAAKVGLWEGSDDIVEEQLIDRSKALSLESSVSTNLKAGGVHYSGEPDVKPPGEDWKLALEAPKLPEPHLIFGNPYSVSTMEEKS